MSRFCHLPVAQAGQTHRCLRARGNTTDRRFNPKIGVFFTAFLPGFIPRPGLVGDALPRARAMVHRRNAGGSPP